MKHSEYFNIEEFVPEDIYLQFGEKAWWFIRPEIVAIADKIRLLLNRTVLINDWSLRGQAQYRGFRPADCKIGAKFSQHRMGAAIDIVVPARPAKMLDGKVIRPGLQLMHPTEVYHFLLDHRSVFVPMGLTTIENPMFTPTWNHLDIRARTLQHPDGDYLVVNP